MKKLFAIVMVMVLMLTLMPSVALAGNGLPDDAKGSHYNLNIIGVQNPKQADMDYDNINGGGGVIFVPLTGKVAINLVEGDDYAVLDKNGTDSDGALLQLPDPGLDPYVVGQDMTGVDTMSDYSVFVRPLGKPGGWTNITTCADVVLSNLSAFLSKPDLKVINDLADLGGYASVEQVGQDITLRTNGKNGKTQFVNVTAELLTIVLKIQILDAPDGNVVDTIYVRVPIFDPIIENEYWEYDNHGLKLLQVRFYPIETDVSAGDGDLFP